MYFPASIHMVRTLKNPSFIVPRTPVTYSPSIHPHPIPISVRRIDHTFINRPYPTPIDTDPLQLTHNLSHQHVSRPTATPSSPSKHCTHIRRSGPTPSHSTRKTRSPTTSNIPLNVQKNPYDDHPKTNSNKQQNKTQTILLKKQHTNSKKKYLDRPLPVLHILC